MSMGINVASRNCYRLQVGILARTALGEGGRRGGNVRFRKHGGFKGENRTLGRITGDVGVIRTAARKFGADARAWSIAGEMVTDVFNARALVFRGLGRH